MVKTETPDVPGLIDRYRRDRNVDSVWDAYVASRDVRLRSLLVEHYRKLCQYQAQRIWRRVPDEVDLMDLIQDGVFGLIDAIEAYDPGRRTKFETYASARIRGAILDRLRSLDLVPRLVRRRRKMLDEAKHDLRDRLGREPSHEDLAAHLSMDEHRLQAMELETASVAFLPLPEPGEPDWIPHRRANDPVREQQRKDLVVLVQKGLSRAERMIVVLYYYEELTMRQIGQVLGLSQSRVSQMHSDLIERMRMNLRGREAEFAIDGIPGVRSRA